MSSSSPAEDAVEKYDWLPNRLAANTCDVIGRNRED